MKQYALLLLSLIALASCVSRDDADAKLEAGCSAAASLFIDDDFHIKKIKSTTSRPSKTFGEGFREITLFAIETDDWVEFDKEYKCTFAEEFGSLNSSYTASIYQANINGRIYGQKDGQLIGSYKDQQKLTKIVEDAMR